MADDVGYTPGSGATIAADDVGGVLHQRVKISVGGDGSATDASTTNPVPAGTGPGFSRLATGVIDANGEIVEISTVGCTHVQFEVTGTWTGSITIEGDAGSGAWQAQLFAASLITNTSFQTLTSNTTALVPVAGWRSIRLRSTAWTSGTANVWMTAFAGQGFLTDRYGQVRVVIGEQADNSQTADVESGLLHVQLDQNGSPVIGFAPHDSATTQAPLLVGEWASAAAPTDVNADGDAVRAWSLRNGARATVLTAAGALIGGDATNGLDVDVTRLPALPAGTNNIGDVDVVTVPAPHASIGTALSIAAAYTAAQTSTDLMAGTGGQRIYVTNLTIATGGTTAGRVSVYWGTGAFSAGTSVTLFDGEFVPSATTKPGAVLTFPVPVGGASATGDSLRITTSAAMTVYVSGQCYKA